VTVVDGVADASSGTFRVRLGLPNEDYSLPSGLRCRVKFLPKDETPEETVVAAPVPQVVPEPDPNTVLNKEAARPYEMVNTAAAPIDSGRQACQTIGPIADASDADRIMATLSGQATQLRLREERQGSVASYLLLAPQQPSLKDSRALTDKMLAAGFSDFYIFPRGAYKGRISLGVHTVKAYAEERQTQLAELGFDSELVPRTEGRSHFWLDVELLPQTAALDLASAEQMLGKTDLAAKQCDVGVGRAQPGQTLAGTSTSR
jgi:hypothetical protein